MEKVAALFLNQKRKVKIVKKKLLSMFLVALLLLVQLTVPAFAADTENASPVLKLAATYDEATNQVTATVKLGSCEGLKGLKFCLQYEQAALSVNSARAAGIVESAKVNSTTIGRVILVYDDVDVVRCEEENKILTVVFKVEGSGDTELRLSETQIYINNSEYTTGEGSILTAMVKLPGTTTDPTTPDPTTPNPTTPDPTTPNPTTPDPTTPNPTTPDPTTPDPTTPDPTTPDPTTPDPTTPDPTTPDIPDPIDPERDIVLVGENNQASYVVTGNTLNVQNDAACVVLWTDDGGETYTKLAATQNEAGGYDFDLTNVPANAVIKIAIKGDMNGDGVLGFADATMVMNAYGNDAPLSKLAELVADVDGISGIQFADATRIMNAWGNDQYLDW